MKKNINNEIWVGCVDSSIATLLEIAPEIIAPYSHALVTSIDSERDLQNLEILKKSTHGIMQYEFLDNNLLLSREAFLTMLTTYDLFNGFDEIWFFLTKPSVKLPSGLWITGPLEIVNDIPAGLIEWMKESGCVLGLGDGIGLNYITRKDTIAEKIEEFLEN